MKCLRNICNNEVKKNRKFCCLSCSISHNNFLKYEKKRIEKGQDLNVKCYCKNCNKDLEFYGTKKIHRTFCSKTCAITYNNKIFHKRKKTESKKYFCVQCNIEIISNKYHKYCSLQCQGKHSIQKTFEKIKSLKNGTRIDSNGKNVGEHSIRNYLIAQYGPVCLKCGWSEKNPVSGKVPIVMNHIDGNSENWLLTNLELLCPNCDSLTPTYKALNKGYGRYKRRQRMKEGKSF